MCTLKCKILVIYTLVYACATHGICSKYSMACLCLTVYKLPHLRAGALGTYKPKDTHCCTISITKFTQPLLQRTPTCTHYCLLEDNIHCNTQWQNMHSLNSNLNGNTCREYLANRRLLQNFHFQPELHKMRWLWSQTCLVDFLRTILNRHMQCCSRHLVTRCMGWKG